VILVIDQMCRMILKCFFKVHVYGSNMDLKELHLHCQCDVVTMGGSQGR
jgi:hypothetical protein